jgi:Domain of unknown function (DUF892)
VSGALAFAAGTHSDRRFAFNGRFRRRQWRSRWLKTWANELGLGNAVRLFDATLEEEKKTDATLTKIAESVVNREAE